jgi:flap endonuclease-1
MGIKNLKKFLRSYDLVKKIHISQFRSKKIAIDTSVIIHQLWYITVNDSIKSIDLRNYEPSENYLLNRFITNFLRFIHNFTRNFIVPVFVFDGVPPVEKNNVIMSRKEVRKQQHEKFLKAKEQTNNEDLKRFFLQSKPPPWYIVHNSIKFVLEAFGVPFIEALNEAEQVCSILAIEKKVDAVYSEDTDNLVFGCPVLISKLYGESIEIILLNEVLDYFKINFEQFKNFCILSGCDYNKNIPRVGIKTSIKYVKSYPKTEELLEFLRNKYGEDNIKQLQFDICLRMFSKKDVLSLIKNVNEKKDLECLELKGINNEKIEKICRIFGIHEQS